MSWGNKFGLEINDRRARAIVGVRRRLVMGAGFCFAGAQSVRSLPNAVLS